MKIESLSWHDGVLGEIIYEPKNSSLTIFLSLYPEQIESSDRNPLKIVCNDVEWFKNNINNNALEEYKTIGNIYDGEMLGPVVRIELYGGDILVKAASYSVQKC